MIRIGLISAATYGPTYCDPAAPRTPGSFHGTAFATTYNGHDEAKANAYDWTFVSAKKRIRGAQVVKVWDPDQLWAERLAEACFIPEVCRTPEAACEGVDAAVVVDDGSGRQWEYALHPLRQGIPTFCDKPLAMTAREAHEVASVARAAGTPFMSASSLRFLPDVVALKEELPAFGDIRLAVAVCSSDLVYYGIHALSLYYALFSSGAVSCVNVGRPGRNIVRVRFASGCDLVLIVADREQMSADFSIEVHGSKAWRHLAPNLDDLYTYLQEQFIRMVVTGEEPVPVEEEVELIAVLEAGKRSLAEGREMAVQEVLDAAPLVGVG